MQPNPSPQKKKLMSKLPSAPKIETVLREINDRVSRLLNTGVFEKVLEPQTDRLDDVRFSLAFQVDFTKNDPKISAKLTYGGRKYQELL